VDVWVMGCNDDHFAFYVFLINGKYLYNSPHFTFGVYGNLHPFLVINYEGMALEYV